MGCSGGDGGGGGSIETDADAMPFCLNRSAFLKCLRHLSRRQQVPNGTASNFPASVIVRPTTVRVLPYRRCHGNALMSDYRELPESKAEAMIMKLSRWNRPESVDGYHCKSSFKNQGRC